MRQLYKTGHANSVLDGKHSERMFDAIEGERKVYRVYKYTKCSTWEQRVKNIDIFIGLALYSQ
jgi:hypothetical protein